MAELLLTGAKGYLGSQVALHLRQNGIAFDVLDTRLQDLAPGTLQHRCVIHCAGRTNRSPEGDYWRDNVVATEHLVRALGADARIIFISTRKVYPLGGDFEMDERCDTAPYCDYGASKLAAEEFIRTSGLRFVTFRAGTMFGHSAQVGKFGDIALQMAVNGRVIPLAIPDRHEDYLDVEVMADILVQAIQDGPHWGQVFNISGPTRSLHGVVAAMGSASEEVLGAAAATQHVDMPIPVFPRMSNLKLQAYFQRTQQLDDRQIYLRMLGRSLEVAK